MARFWICAMLLLAMLVTAPACKKKTEQPAEPAVSSDVPSEAPAEPTPAPEAPQT